MIRPWLKEMAAKAIHEIAAEGKQLLAHGAHETTAAIWNQSAFVMYPRGTRDDKQNDNMDHASPTPEIEREI